MTWGLTPGKLGFKLGDVLVGLQSGTTDTPESVFVSDHKAHVLGYVWNPDALAYEVLTGGGEGVGLEVQVTNLADGRDKAVLTDVVSSTVTYVGKAAPGSATSASVWKIARLTITDEGDLTMVWAGGAATYASAWDDRLGLSYT